jgi:hypothetical protein
MEWCYLKLRGNRFGRLVRFFQDEMVLATLPIHCV